MALTIVGYYFRAVGASNFLLLAACMASYSFFLYFSQYVLKWWAAAGGKLSWLYAGSYTLCATACLASTCGQFWFVHIRLSITLDKCAYGKQGLL